MTSTERPTTSAPEHPPPLLVSTGPCQQSSVTAEEPGAGSKRGSTGVGPSSGHEPL